MGVQRRVAVIGGGISGLATAFFLTHQDRSGTSGEPDADLEVTLLEAQPRLGGKIRTADVAGFGVDTGPDAILARSPLVEGLLGDLGLLDVLSRPALRRAYVWTRGGLRPLPPTSLFGVPDTPFPLLRSRVLSPWGALRASADFVLPRRALPPDPTIAQLLRPRFGREVFDRLIEPMLGGVHAGRADVLSARSAVPEVYAAARANRSTYLALRRRESPRQQGLGMVTVQGGLSRLVEALRGTLDAADVRTGSAVTTIEHVVRGGCAEPAARGEHVVRGGCAEPAARGEHVVRGGCAEPAARGEHVVRGGCAEPAARGGCAEQAARGGRVGRAGRAESGFRVTVARPRTVDGTPDTPGGVETLDVDAVVLATPAQVSAALLAPLSRQASMALAEIPYAGVATVTLAYPRAVVRRDSTAPGSSCRPRRAGSWSGAPGRRPSGRTWPTTSWRCSAARSAGTGTSAGTTCPTTS